MNVESFLFLATSIYLFAFCLFPATWKAWLVALVLVAPAYFTFFVQVADKTAFVADRHGWGMMFLLGAVYPPAAGHLVRAASLFAQSKGLSRRRALSVDLAGFAVAATLLILLRDYWFVPFEFEPFLEAPAPLEKIE